MSEEVWYNDIAASTLFTRTCTNAETNSPVGNAVTEIVQNKTISTGIGNWYYTFNGTAANTIKGFAVFGLNTGTWTTIQAQGSNNDFTDTLATQNLTVVTRSLDKFDYIDKKVESNTQYMAYCKTDWSYQDYRILFNSAAVSWYEIGRIYIFTQVMEIKHPSDIDQPADITTVSTIIQGDGGQYIKLPRYQSFSYDLDIKRTTKDEADKLVKTCNVNPSLCYFVDDLVNGELFFGNFDFSRRTTHGPVFGTSKINLQGKFIESL